jgi:hypothetical protein
MAYVTTLYKLQKLFGVEWYDDFELRIGKNVEGKSCDLF